MQLLTCGFPFQPIPGRSMLKHDGRWQGIAKPGVASSLVFWHVSLSEEAL